MKILEKLEISNYEKWIKKNKSYDIGRGMEEGKNIVIMELDTFLDLMQAASNNPLVEGK